MNFDTITQYVKKHRLFDHGSHIVIGLSGGPDSVFLLHYLLSQRDTYNLTLTVAHLNHQWRAEADQEEQFCRELAIKYDLPFVSKKMAELLSNTSYNGSKEAYARHMRRMFLESVCHQHNAQAIALAHHADDQQETFFIRLMRGATLTGLTGMRPKHGLYIRPLLETSKQTILHYLDTHNIPYVTDISNESPLFLRNRIRTTVIPALKACDNRFDINFAHTLERLQQTEDFFDSFTKEVYATIVTYKDNHQWINLLLLKKQHAVIQERLIMHWLCQENVQFPVSYAFLQEMVRFLHNSKGGTHRIHTQWCIIKQKGHARIHKDR